MWTQVLLDISRYLLIILGCLKKPQIPPNSLVILPFVRNIILSAFEVFPYELIYEGGPICT